MDPGTMMLLAGLASSIYGSATGGQGEQKSSFSKGQQGGIQDILDMIKSMSSGSADITKNQGYQQGQGWLNDLFNDPDFFKNFEAPLQRQFEEQTVPDLANRFASMGSGGALGSTGFRNQLAREGSNLHTNIAALRGGMQQQGVNQQLGYAQQPFSNLMQLYQTALGQPVNNQYQPPNAGVGNLAAPLISGGVQYWGNQNKTPGQSPSTY